MSEAAADVKVNPAVKPKPRRTVDTTSVASSDFEEVRLEDIETASEEVDWTPSSEEEINSKRSSPKKKGVVGKNTTVPAPSHTMADDQAEASATSAAAVKKSPPASEISSAEPTVTTEGKCLAVSPSKKSARHDRLASWCFKMRCSMQETPPLEFVRTEERTLKRRQCNFSISE